MLEFKLEPVDCFISLFFGVPFLFIVVFLTEYFLSEVCAMYRMISVPFK